MMIIKRYSHTPTNMAPPQLVGRPLLKCHLVGFLGANQSLSFPYQVNCFLVVLKTIFQLMDYLSNQGKWTIFFIFI